MDPAPPAPSASVARSTRRARACPSSLSVAAIACIVAIGADSRLEVRELQGDIVGVLPCKVGIRRGSAVPVRAMARRANLAERSAALSRGRASRSLRVPAPARRRKRSRSRQGTQNARCGSCNRAPGSTRRPHARARCVQRAATRRVLPMKKQSIVADSPRPAKARSSRPRAGSARRRDVPVSAQRRRPASGAGRAAKSRSPAARTPASRARSTRSPGKRGSPMRAARRGARSRSISSSCATAPSSRICRDMATRPFRVR